MNLDFKQILTYEEKINMYNGELLDEKVSKKIINDWLKNDNLLDYENLITKLNMENISIQQFATSINNNKFDDLNPPDWYNLYYDIIKEYSNSNNFEFYHNESIMYFLNCYIYWSKIYLNKNINKYNNIRLSNEIINKILDSIGENLFMISCKTIVYEYYNQGETNFKNYNINNFKDIENIEKFHSKYPVLAKRLSIKVTCLLDTYLDSLNKIDRDFQEIQSSLDIKLGKIITNISGNLGDTHENGKFVIQYEFDEKIKIVYKPKELFVSKYFYEIIYWINKNSSFEKIIIPRNYYANDYTIESYIESEQCINENQIKRYYKRLGQLLAVIYQLNGSDFHYENVIACGEFPYLIDLETLFQQPIPLKKEDIFDFNNYKIQESINSTCFLPINNAYANKDGKGIDVSALCYKKQKLPYKVLSLIGDMDNPKFDYIDYEFETQNNIPILDMKNMDYRNYINQIQEGFFNISKFIIDSKKEFLEKIKIFQNVKIRQIMRNTVDYGKLLENASHPKYTINMTNLQKMFYSIWDYKFENKQLITSEVEDLLNDDIPMFKITTTSKDLIDSKGRIIKNYFNKSSFDYVKERIINFDEKALYKQLDYLNISLENSKNIINEKLRIKNDLYRFNNILFKSNKFKNSNTIIGNINIDLNNYYIKYNDQCLLETLSNDKVNLEIGFENGLCGIYCYLYTFNRLNNYNNTNIDSISKVFSNKKILGFGLRKNEITDLLDVLNIIENTLDTTFDKNLLIVKSTVIEIIEEQLTTKKIIISDIVKSIKVLSKLYNTRKSYELKKIILDLKYALENSLLKYGLNSLRFNNSIGISDILYCSELIDAIYPNNKLQINIDYLNEINNQYLNEILNIENINSIDAEEFRNILRNLNFNLQTNYIDSNIIEKNIVSIIGNRVLDETIIYIIDILINLYLKNSDCKIKNLLDEKVSDLIKYYSITDSYPISEMYYFKNLSIKNGLCGIGYELLRYNNIHINSILEII